MRGEINRDELEKKREMGLRKARLRQGHGRS